jgi:hypothetical protein
MSIKFKKKHKYLTSLLNVALYSSSFFVSSYSITHKLFYKVLNFLKNKKKELIHFRIIKPF